MVNFSIAETTDSLLNEIHSSENNSITITALMLVVVNSNTPQVLLTLSYGLHTLDYC